MIVCPKCGLVTKYAIKEAYSRTVIFNERDEYVSKTEERGVKHGLPRCLKCGRAVKFYKDPDCVGGLRTMHWYKWEKEEGEDES